MQLKKHLSISQWLAHFAERNRVSRLAFMISVLTAASISATPSAKSVTIGNYGKLAGALNGWAWVAPGEQTTVVNPNPCNNSGCFKDTGGKLCIKGHINALTCTGQGTSHTSCNWDKNWGVVLGLNTTDPQGPWGTSAPMKVAIGYTSAVQGGTTGHYRLNAHLVGDPYSKQYCIDNYTPGAVVQASDFKSQCWFDTGDRLPSFRTVDQIGLLRTSEYGPVDFDFCVTSIIAE